MYFGFLADATFMKIGKSLNFFGIFGKISAKKMLKLNAKKNVKTEILFQVDSSIITQVINTIKAL